MFPGNIQERFPNSHLESMRSLLVVRSFINEIYAIHQWYCLTMTCVYTEDLIVSAHKDHAQAVYCSP